MTERTTLPPALRALDAAVRGISGVFDLEQVLQLIVDRVRDLVDAQYAALGIVDDEGLIVQFITSGITTQQREAIGELPRGRGLLGLIIRENRSYRIPYMAAHPESYGFPPNHPAMASFLGVPVTVKGEPVGRLYLTNKRGAAEFSADDQALVEMFALHAGIAIENARLHDQVQRLAVVGERDRISRDLHDSVIQSIYAVTLALDDVPDLVESAPESAKKKVEDAIDALHYIVRDIRNFIFGLRPLLVESGDLMHGLRALGDELGRNTGVDVEVRGETADDLRLETVADLLAIAREALANVARHARARRATISLTVTDGSLRLEVADDGIGFSSEQAAAGGHHGMSNMRTRAERMGARFTVESASHAGTRIIVDVPAQGAARVG